MNAPSPVLAARSALAQTFSRLPPEAMDETQLARLAWGFAREASDGASVTDRDELTLAAVGEYLGNPDLAEALMQPEVSEIMINGPGEVVVERDGRRQRAPWTLGDEATLRGMVSRILHFNPGRRLDAASPYADLYLPGGLRVNVVVPPVALGGTHLTIRRYGRKLQRPEDLVAVGTLDATMDRFLRAAVAARLNVLFIGATGGGKTTLLDLYATTIDPEERVVVIEDTYEVRLEKANVVRLLSRPANIEGRGAITIAELFRNALRMRPQRVILGEIRGAEALDYLQAINSEHGGTLAVLHAGSPQEAVLRLEHLVARSGIVLPSAITHRQLAAGLDLIVSVALGDDGVRRVTSITETSGLDNDGITALVELFRWNLDKRRFEATGFVPASTERLARVDPGLAEAMFPVTGG